MEFIVFLILFALGFGVGRHAESSHYKSIKKRESETLHVPVVTFENLPDERPVSDASLAVGSVVISVDYYKRVLAGFRMFFGGEMRSYSPLLDHARREAILRMKESHPRAHLFLNCRFETASISKGKQKSIGCVEVVAYSTAITYVDAIHSQAAL